MKLVEEKSWAFAIRIIRLYEYLCEKKKFYKLAEQLLRSGTSIGANVAEAYHAQSAKDFLSKFNIALKEANETAYWLDLFYETGYLTEKQYSSIKVDCSELARLLSSSVKTKKKNISQEN